MKAGGGSSHPEKMKEALDAVLEDVAPGVS